MIIQSAYGILPLKWNAHKPHAGKLQAKLTAK